MFKIIVILFLSYAAAVTLTVTVPISFFTTGRGLFFFPFSKVMTDSVNIYRVIMLARICALIIVITLFKAGRSHALLIYLSVIVTDRRKFLFFII